jgi:hypothetical protein
VREAYSAPKHFHARRGKLVGTYFVCAKENYICPDTANSVAVNETGELSLVVIKTVIFILAALF